MAIVCADLCKAYAELGQLEQAKHDFDEGVTLAKKQRHTVAIIRNYPSLELKIDELPVISYHNPNATN